MAVVQKNTYNSVSNRDLTNVALNLDLQRLGTDLTSIEYSGGNFLVKVGSLIEANGSMFSVVTSDYSIAPSTGVIVFDSATQQYSISATAYTYDATKAGYYINGSPTKRVTKWSVQSTGLFSELIEIRQTLNVYKSGTDTQNNWFDAFAPYLPIVGDESICTGGWSTLYASCKMTRTSTTVITVTGHTGGSTVTTTFTNGDGTNFTGVLAI